MNRQSRIILLILFVFGLLTYYVLTFMRPKAQQEVTQEVVVVQQASYLDVTREDMVEVADAIFLGNVVAVSSTRWNQDSGEEWNDDVVDGGSGLQIHIVEVEILQPIVDTIGLDKTVEITVLGRSPKDGYADHALQKDSQAVFFIMKTELAWRGNETRPVFIFIGAPAYSYFMKRSDGLYHDERSEALALSFEDIVNFVAERRVDVITP